MTAFVILAGGRGTRIGRVGESLHKCLAPLAGRAIISHQIALAPADARIVVCLGYRGPQIIEYLTHAHPNRNITYVRDERWSQPHSGPGTGLLAARVDVGDDDMIFTSCDTLWEPDPNLFVGNSVSWSAVAPTPAGTALDRWCRIAADANGVATAIYDKVTMPSDTALAYVGMSFIRRADLTRFWEGIEESTLVHGETQVTGGLDDIPLHTRRVDWTDVGDATSYQHAVERYSGFDWTKLGQATYVLPETGRVVKFHENSRVIASRYERGQALTYAVPKLTGVSANMFSYEYVSAPSVYAQCSRYGTTITSLLCRWYDRNFWETRTKFQTDLTHDHVIDFYCLKTRGRIEMLPEPARRRALDAIKHIDWEHLASGVQVGLWHGDFNMGNVLSDAYDSQTESTGVQVHSSFVAIDWREDFAGAEPYGDLRYDIAKLLAGTYVHWENAQRGDFRVWDAAEHHRDVIRRWITTTKPTVNLRDVEIIGALSLLNSAPLHAAPLSDILVTRAIAWLEALQ